MPPPFDLRHAPWIPLTTRDGARATVGLREALVRAQDYADFAIDQPLQYAAVLRLLVALLHRIYQGPADIDASLAMRDAGAFDAARIDDYLEQWGDRFDLFHPTHPFGQVPGLLARAGESVDTISRIVPDAPGQKKAVLFDHRAGIHLSPAEAALSLLAWQAFALGRGQGQWRGEVARTAKDAPIARHALTFVRGGTLFQTLLRNLAFYRHDPADAPAWERDPLTGSGVRRPAGRVDLLTYRSRAVELGCDTHGSVTTVVEYQGEDDDLSSEELARLDPFVAARRRWKQQDGQDPYVRIGVEPDRAFWRDLQTLVAVSSEYESTLRRPQILDHHADIAVAGEGEELLPLLIIGQGGDQAKIECWRQESLTLATIALLEGPTGADRRRVIAQAIAWAEGGERALLRSGAFGLIARDRQRDRELARHFVNAPGYWGRIDRAIRQLMPVLAAPAMDAGAILHDWNRVVHRTAWETFREATSSFFDRPMDIAAAEDRFARTLGIALQHKE